MRTSLSEIERIEKYILGTLSPQASLLFTAQLLTDPVLRLHVALQRKVYKLLHVYHRRRLKDELDQFHQRLFEDPGHEEFRSTIYKLFNN
ncbi:MAG TPA: hypothetical protein VK666_21345 [Chryseolinea sp.]|nr:hypothetical protein [Chryseolinea sp.]